MAFTPIRVVSEAGIEAHEFTTCSIKQSFMDPLGSVELDMRPAPERWEEYFDQFQKGNEVSVWLGEAGQGYFIIQDVKYKIGVGGTSMHLSCQSLLATASEAHMDPDFALKGKSDSALWTVLLDVFEPYGFTLVKTDLIAHVDAVTGKPLPGGKENPNLIGDMKANQLKAHPEQTILHFVNSIITRLGCVLHVDFERALCVVEPNYTQANAYSIGLSTKPYSLGAEFDLFEGDVEVHASNKGQYSQVGVVGKASAKDANPSRPKSGDVKAADVLPALCVYTSFSHGYKPLYWKDKLSRDTKQARNAAHLVLGAHAKDAYKVSGKVPGWVSKSGRVWTPGTMCRVVVDKVELDAPMFLLSRTLHLTADGGQTTDLEFIPKGSLILGEKPKGASKATNAKKK